MAGSHLVLCFQLSVKTELLYVGCSVPAGPVGRGGSDGRGKPRPHTTCGSFRGRGRPRHTNRRPYRSFGICLQMMVVCPVLESILVFKGIQAQETVLAFSCRVTTQCSIT
jgi:hypothetical protein